MAFILKKSAYDNLNKLENSNSFSISNLLMFPSALAIPNKK